MGVEPVDLTPRQGKCLRYLCDRPEPVVPARLVVRIEWSDLPHTLLQARAALERLRAHKLVERVGKTGYTPTSDGRALIRRANKDKCWNS